MAVDELKVGAAHARTTTLTSTSGPADVRDRNLFEPQRLLVRAARIVDMATPCSLLIDLDECTAG
jgi:hypothetical protein